MRDDVIYPNEKTVIDDMVKNNLKKVVMFITSYIDQNDNLQKYGYTVKNIDKGYYVNQKSLSSPKKTFFNVN